MAYMGASPSGVGSARAQNQLKGLLTTLGMHVYNGGVEVMVSKADEQFDERGGLKDERLKQGVRDLLVGLRDWTKRLST